MGNCQAIDAAALVIQHPSGRVERLYWQVSVSEVMKMNPGHYVALIVTLCLSEERSAENNPVRVARVKLLRPTDNLVLGHAYRLIPSQEVMEGLRAKKYAKMKKNQSELAEKPRRASETQNSGCQTEATSDSERNNQAVTHERRQQRTTSTNPAAVRPKHWRPSLHSISEAGSR
ncbi:hypothetical protein HHK36_007094 [Tetracentron sinense]|uniref:Uncharacterized protein n=1 Tax=Tetracentron sinense TaxID=13715 RepID=A0A834ZIB8_TETSI|nr:hypothetical protein HHK36_007094 [Tetracentron sinense]